MKKRILDFPGNCTHFSGGQTSPERHRSGDVHFPLRTRSDPDQVAAQVAFTGSSEKALFFQKWHTPCSKNIAPPGASCAVFENQKQVNFLFLQHSANEDL